MKELAMQPNGATNLPGGFILALLVLTLLAGLPTAVWLDLTNLSDAALRAKLPI
jgi:hypothetical protein